MEGDPGSSARDRNSSDSMARSIFRRLVRIITAVLAAIGLLLAAVTFSPLVGLWTGLLAGQPSVASGNVMVVLGGSTQVLSTGIVLDQPSYWMCEYAKTVYRQANFKRIIITDTGSAGTPVTVLMADQLQLIGVAPDVIEIESKSNNLHEQAAAVKAMLGDESEAVLLTSDYRMFRASRAFTKAGIRVRPLPVGDASVRAEAGTLRWSVLFQLLNEQVKIVEYWARRWI
jgi:uncharacterized SAM-binding protein YcdF (DUF218 family)